MNWEKERQIRQSLTPGVICALVDEHGPVTSADLAAVVGLDVTPFRGLQASSCVVASRIASARRHGYPIARRRVGPAFEYAVRPKQEPATVIFDHGGWE